MKKIVLLISFVVLNSCFSSKETIEGVKMYSPKKSIRNANKNINTIQYIQARAKISFLDNKKVKSNNVTLRILSDEKIWANAALGAVRVLIDKDSIKYYNKIEKNFFVSDFDYLNNRIGIQANFKMLQNLILGILVDKFETSSYYQKIDNNYLYKKNFKINSKLVESIVFINPYNFTINKQVFINEDKKFEVHYNNYLSIDNQNIPTKIRFLSNGKESLIIDFKSITSLDKINMPFKIPKSHRRINL